MRRGIWLVIGFVALILALWLTMPGGDYQSIPLFHWGIYLVPLVLSTTASAFAAVRTQGIDRRFWTILAACCGLVLANDSVYLWNLQLTGSTPPAASPRFVFILVVGLALFSTLLVVASNAKKATLPTRMRVLVDLFIVAAVGGVIAHLWFVVPLLESVGVTDIGEQLSSTLRVVVGFIVLVGAAVLALGMRHADWRAWERATLLGVATYAAGFMLWPVYFIAELAGPSTLLLITDSLWVTGHYLVFAGAVFRLSPSTRSQELRGLPPFHVRGRWLPLVFHATALLLLPLFGWTAFVSGDHTTALIAIGGSIVVALLLVARDFWVGVESGRLSRAAVLDHVTGASTEPLLREHLVDLVDMSIRRGAPFSIVCADIDNLMAVNSIAGHAAGDELLIDCARVVRSNVPANAMVARVDGDTFIAVLSGTDHPEAMMIAEGIRAQVALVTRGTVAVGVGSFPHDELDPHALLVSAKEAAGFASRHGGDRVVSARRASAGLTPDGGQGSGDSRIATLRLLAAAVDSRHAGTRNHSMAVADLAVALGQRIGLPDERIDVLRLAAQVHDVGMIGVPAHLDCDEHLSTAVLSPELRAHTVLGEQIAAAAGLGVAATWLRSHHERWDGTGYPDGLRGPEIPIESRILAVCDAFAGLTTPHGDRSALSPKAALQEIDLNLGTKYDPEVAEAFLQLAEERFVWSDKATQSPESYSRA